MTNHNPFRFFLGEGFWLVPFVCIGLIAVVPTRPPPLFPEPSPNRTVEDAEGMPVAIPLLLPGVVGGNSDFLELTHAPEVLVSAGTPGDRARFASGIMSRIYPQIVKSDALWNSGDGLEALLAQDAGWLYFRWSPGDVTSLRRFGLPVLRLGWKPETRDASIFTATRITNEALGRTERGEAFIADYKQSFADLRQDLRPESLKDHPRALEMVSRSGDWPFLWVHEASRFDDVEQRTGVENASAGHINIGRYQDAERILAMNPDIVFVLGDTPQGFLRDPRWRGLKAVRDNRVYQDLRELRGSLAGLHGLDYRPLWARWLAEVAHPDRLQPKLRALMRAHYQQSYGYTLSDDELDNLLRIDENKDAPGYARFLKAADQGTSP